MDKTNLPDKYWHCQVSTHDKQNSIVNDLTLEKLFKEIVEPWHAGRPFSVDGRIVRKKEDVAAIKISYTEENQQAIATQHNNRMASRRINDFLTNRRALPLSGGEDFTHRLLFSELKPELPSIDEQLIVSICQRLPAAARILANRRAQKPGFKLDDEYDVQDFLHSLIRAYVRFSVQEDPIGKIAGSKSSRADISIEEIGVLIEIKFVRSPDDQRAIVKQFSEDLVLYTKWAPLKTLLYVIFNSADLQDPEALLALDGRKEIGGKVFVSKMILI